MNVDWGDGTITTTTMNSSNGAGSDNASHNYTVPGVYTLNIDVADDDGSVANQQYQYIVVFDPENGFVTGGGWITSPLGAYTADPTLTGKANFGFNAKYKNGANVPDGNTEFQFKAGNLNFHSSSYDWLVVAGPRGQFKGVGTINNTGIFGFMLTAVDGQVPGGGGEDKFRIKIWDIASDVIIYDNQLGDTDDASATTLLGGGQIMIHSK